MNRNDCVWIMDTYWWLLQRKLEKTFFTVAVDRCHESGLIKVGSWEWGHENEATPPLSITTDWKHWALDLMPDANTQRGLKGWCSLVLFRLYGRTRRKLENTIFFWAPPESGGHDSGGNESGGMRVESWECGIDATLNYYSLGLRVARLALLH